MTINKAACIGGGVIGAGWVARLLLNGIDVSIYDPDPEAQRKVGEVMKGARRAYRKMLPDGLPKEGKLTFAKTIAEAATSASGVVFDGSDVMPKEVGSGTFWTGMVEWIQGVSSQETTAAIEASWPQ